MWKAGHSLIKKKIFEVNALAAGEVSGHVFFNDKWFGFDDAVYAGARLLEILAATRRTAWPKCTTPSPQVFNTPEIRVDCRRRRQVPRRRRHPRPFQKDTAGDRHRRRPGQVPARLGPGPRLEHPAVAGRPLRGRLGRGTAEDPGARSTRSSAASRPRSGADMPFALKIILLALVQGFTRVLSGQFQRPPARFPEAPELHHPAPGL